MAPTACRTQGLEVVTPRRLREAVKIVQMSDLHVGAGLFRPELLRAAVRETNELAPDLVVIAGDLTMDGYRREFEECREFLSELECPHVAVAMGNHDVRNVGYRHFEDCFGARDSVAELRGWTVERFVRYDADPFGPP